MSTSVASAVKFFPSAENGFTTTTSGSVASGATTVGLNSVAGYANGEVIVFTIDPEDVTKKQAFTGVVDTSGVQITGVVWTSGTNQTHIAGATVVDYVDAAHISLITKGVGVEHNQDGTHSDITADSVTADTGTFTSLTIAGTASAEGWSALGAAPSTVATTGNRFYTMVFSGNDLTDTLSPDMKLKMTRTVTAPVKCTDLESGSSQYYSKSSPNGMTFTDDFVVSAWIKLESYPSVLAPIAARYNGTSGWAFQVDSTGQLSLKGYNASASNVSQVASIAAIPLNKWVHVAAQLDMSAFTATTTTSYIMFDGVDVAALVTRAGTNPTALIQAGDLQVGKNDTTNYFDGKIAQVAIYSAKVTQATILASMNQTLSGAETSLVSAYSFNNSIVDLNANANNLTANGSAVATNSDSPFAGGLVGTTEYGTVVDVVFSTDTTVTVLMAEGNLLPTTGGVSVVNYSTHQSPYGFPVNSRLVGQSMVQVNSTTTSTTAVQYPGLTVPIIVPTGGRWYTIKVSQTAFLNSGNEISILTVWDGVVASGVQLGQANNNGTSTTYDSACILIDVYLTAGAHTINAGKATTGSTATFGNAVGQPAQLSVRYA